jgi:hypothetical protein
MYTAFGMVMGAMIGCAIMATYDLGMAMGLAGALIGGAMGSLAELMPKRRSQPTA